MLSQSIGCQPALGEEMTSPQILQGSSDLDIRDRLLSQGQIPFLHFSSS